ncbi:MAG: hypothetical protein IPP93_09140 [Chitinophagaceae bacterium]|nr:hypothetical protein [Chitinophagaceae bacterium]
MRNTISILACLLFTANLNAQQPKLITDVELIFTAAEKGRIDSLLQDYHKRSGNYVVVCTDTLDISTDAYKDSLVEVYTPESIRKPYAFFLLLSRRNSRVFLVSNELTEEVPNLMDEIYKIVGYGIPALKEKKVEEAVTIISKKAMEFLDALPPRN